jgi:amino acid transporter
MVFGILSYVGFEAATTLGEEVRDPHRNIPRALMLSLVFVGVIYLFCTYSEMVGFGVGQVDELVSETAPFTTLAARYAAWMGPLVGLAGISSIFAVVMNSNNGVVRIIYAMGREGMLPQRLGHVHPTHQTPSTAIWFQAVFAAAVTYLVGFIAGPFNAYVYLGSVLTLAIIPVYIFTQLGVMRFFRGEGRAEFSVWKHAILPVLGILLLLIPIYGQVYPVPDAPLRYFPYLVIMFIAVAAVAAAIIERKRAGLLQQAGAAMAGADDVADDPTRDPTPLR